MRITSIGNQIIPAKNAASGDAPAGFFSDILARAIENVKDAEEQDNLQTVGLVTGTGADLHSAMLAMEKADLALQFTVQIRNKILEAYNEVMRLQF
ncbi:MAG: flagellar hook-basal body complex protein FliE [Clostridiales bacterium]|jgi:flagellar hook-basal body complex protein FliE|nr:flagellar hook-basal body complex protein FliE [Clostridiales bacterium]